MSSRRQEHEKYLRSILSKSLSSEQPSKDTVKKAAKNSKSHFQDLKEGLMNKYQEYNFEDIEGSEVIENKYGETLKITQKEKIKFSLKENNLKKDLLNDLKILPQIGASTEIKLKEEGFHDLYSLLDNEKYSKNAELAINQIESYCFVNQYNLLKKSAKYSKSSKNNIIKSAVHLDPYNLKFMDIETLGLSNVPVILIGIAEIKGKYIESNQYLLRNKSEEPAAIESYLSHLDEVSIHVTYNGASFDVPFIKNRARNYRMKYNLDQTHFDLIYFARNLWKDKLPNCKLTTIEENIFDIHRKDDVPGAYIPDYYETYLKKNNIGPLIPIIEHNRMDIVSLASFLMKIYNEVVD